MPRRTITAQDLESCWDPVWIASGLFVYDFEIIWTHKKEKSMILKSFETIFGITLGSIWDPEAINARGMPKLSQSDQNDLIMRD